MSKGKPRTVVTVKKSMPFQDQLRKVLEAVPGGKEYADEMMKKVHPVSAACKGEKCRMCKAAATHKVAEEILFDDPLPNRHPLTAYLCCDCFGKVVGEAAVCFKSLVEGDG